MKRLSLLVFPILLAGCAEDPPAANSPEFIETIEQAEIPAEFQAGQVAFQENCSACHGTRGLGSAQGPPLINIIYEPSHHGDMAFFMAANRGVRAHHWNFGDMPALPQVSNEDLQQIVAYVRYLQRQVGIQ